MASRDCLVVLTLVILLAGCLPSSLSTSLPGLQILISKKGLDYTNSVALTALSTELKGLNIPNQHGKEKNIEWTLTGIQNRGVTAPSSAMRFDPSHNGLTWIVGGLGIDLHATHWRVKYKKGWFKVSTSGSVDLKVKRASLRVTLSLAQSGGRPSVSMSRCYASIGDVDVYFYGGTSFILNLFRGMIGNKIKNLVQGQICNAARKLINLDLNKELAELKVNVDLGKNFLLDYSIVSSPKVTATSLVMQNKGEIYWKDEVEEASFSPKPLPELTNESHMMYLWVSEFVANSAIHHAHSHGFLQYNVTDQDFLSDKASFMDTSCSLFCVGNLLPVIGMQYPDSKVEASISALGTPILSISPQGISLNGNARIDLHVTTDKGKIYNVINLEMLVYLSVTGSVLHERIAGEITEHRLEIKEIRSIIGDIDPETMNAMLKVALDLGIIPGLNAVMKQGIDLPVTEVLSFKDTRLSLHDGSVLIATDVTAVTSSPTQEELKKELQLEKERRQLQQLLLLQRKQKEQQQKTEVQPITATSKAPTEQQTEQQQLYTTFQPRVEQMTTTVAEDNETTAQTQELMQSTQGQGRMTQSAHKSYCDRVINFCLASMDFCN